MNRQFKDEKTKVTAPALLWITLELLCNKPGPLWNRLEDNIKIKYSYQLKTQPFNQPWDRDIELKTQ